MRFHELVREQWIPRPLDLLFAFFERPENLALITPPWLAFRILSPSPVPMAEGRLIDYQIRLKGVPIRWRTLISTYRPPECFVDEQINGPYGYWRHLHRFEPRGDHTLAADQVCYALPPWLATPAEDAIHKAFVRPALEAIFDYREDMLTRLFGPSGQRARHRRTHL